MFEKYYLMLSVSVTVGGVVGEVCIPQHPHASCTVHNYDRARIIQPGHMAGKRRNTDRTHFAAYMAWRCILEHPSQVSIWLLLR